MRDELSILRLVPGDQREVFRYFVEPRLLEMWSYPDDMILNVCVFWSREAATCRFEHRGKDGAYLATGNIIAFAPGTKLAQTIRVVGPKGELVHTKLESVITFTPKLGGTEVAIRIRGFTDEKLMRECEVSWGQCFDRLVSLFVIRHDEASA